MRVCELEICSKEIFGHFNRRFCDDECKRISRLKPPSNAPSLCAFQYCEVWFVGDSRQKFCSKNCISLKAYYKAHPRVEGLVCATVSCDELVIGKKRGARFCSHPCQNRESQRVLRLDEEYRLAGRVKHAQWQRYNRASTNAYSRKYGQTPKGKARSRKATRARRAREACMVPQRWIKRDDVDEDCCYWCGKRNEGGNHHEDHLHPVMLGGNNDASNLHLACAECNLSKSGKHPLVWLAEQFT